MSLGGRRGPLGTNPDGRFSTPLPDDLFYVEPFRRRVRGFVGDRAVVDSERVVLVHRAGAYTTYSFPSDDVDVEGATPDPDVEGYVRVPRGAIERWYEEEEQVVGPRNPYHRVDIVRTSRQLRVAVGDTTLVDTNETHALYETSLDPVLYVDPDHVRMDLLVRSETTTYCPYKGTATHWSTADVQDVAWSYEDPLPESLPIKGMLAFYTTRATVEHKLPSADRPG